MSLIHDLSFLAVRPFLGEAGDALLAFFNNRFGDHTRRVTLALEVAAERAWRSLEFTLGRTGWWEAVPLSMAAREERAFRAQVKSFLDSVPPVILPGDPDTFRARCLTELRSARKVGLVPGRGLAVDELASRGLTLAGHSDPLRHLEADRQAVGRLAETLRREGYADLGHYLELRPARGEPLLVLSVRYFFRREVEADPRLAATLAHAKQERMSAVLESGFETLHLVLKQHGEAAEEVLSGVAGLVGQTHEEVKQTHEDVRALREQLEKQGQQIQELYQALLALSRQGQASQEQPPTCPRGRSGKPLLSPLFAAGLPSGQAPAAPPAPEAGAPPPKPRRRLLSPLFEPPPEVKGS